MFRYFNHYLAKPDARIGKPASLRLCLDVAAYNNIRSSYAA